MMDANIDNVLLVATLISVLLYIVVTVGSKCGKWITNRDKRLAKGADIAEEAISVRTASADSELEIKALIRANQETNTKIGQLHEMVERLDVSGSKGSARMLDKFDIKLEGFGRQLVDFDKKLVRLETIINNGRGKTP